MPARLAVVDVETFGLEPDRHDIFEIAILRRDEAGDWSEYAWFLTAGNLGAADPNALRVNRFYDRLASLPDDTASRDPQEVAAQVAALTAGCWLVGANVAFDEKFLEPFLRKHGYAPAWDYHAIDVETAVAVKLDVQPPWKSDELSRMIGVEPPAGAQRHTALGDARWAKELYEAAYGLRPNPAQAPKRRRPQAPAPEPVAAQDVARREPEVVPVDEPVAEATDAPEPEEAHEADVAPTPTTAADAASIAGAPDVTKEHPCSDCEEEDRRTMIDGERALRTWIRYRRVLCTRHFDAMKLRAGEA